MNELHQVLQGRSITTFTRLAIVFLFFALGDFANGDNEWKSRLTQVEWLNPGTRLRESLRLRADGTFAIVIVSKKAVSDGAPGDGKRFKFAESTITQTGTWQVLSTSHQLIRLDYVDEPDSVRTEGVRIAVIDGEKPQCRVQHVTLIQPQDKPMVISDRLLVADGFSVQHDDLARWPNERDISSRLGPATGIDTEKRSIVTDASLNKIKKLLPASWSADRIGNAVVICRGEKIETELNAPSGPGFLSAAVSWNERREGRYVIAVHFEHRMQPDERQQQKEHATNKIAALLPSMEHFKDPPNTKPSGFGYQPKTPPDQKLFEQFRGFQRAIDELPDFYDDHFSVTIEDGLWRYEWILSDAVRKECADTLDRVEKQYSRYEPQLDETGSIDVAPGRGHFVLAPRRPDDADDRDDQPQGNQEVARIRQQLEQLKASVVTSDDGEIAEVHWNGKLQSRSGKSRHGSGLVAPERLPVAVRFVVARRASN